jgi:hypothetical protein
MLIQHVQPVRLPVRSLGTVARMDVVFWTIFAAAAIVFVMDATATIHVTALRPAVVEQNPIARWTLEAHPAAPYLLKAAIITECAVIAAAMRAMGERGAAFAVATMMAAIGLLGIATAVQSLTA